MDTLTIHIDPSDASTPLNSVDSSSDPLGWRGTLRHPVVAFQRMFHIEFELEGCLLCDDDSLHADLIDLFERGNAPTARPEA